MFTIIRINTEGRDEIIDRVLVGTKNIGVVRSHVQRELRKLRDADPDATYRVESTGAAK